MSSGPSTSIWNLAFSLFSMGSDLAASDPSCEVFICLLHPGDLLVTIKGRFSISTALERLSGSTIITSSLMSAPSGLIAAMFTVKLPVEGGNQESSPFCSLICIPSGASLIENDVGVYCASIW